MRTTLNIADDVLLAIKKRARRDKRPIGEILSDLVRRELMRCTASQEPSPFFGFAPLPRRGNVVSNELIDRLRKHDLG
jgi:hypothetical protein